MRAVIQRVERSSVEVEHENVGSIGKGLMVLLGVSEDDEDSDLDYIYNKLVNLRIFEDSDGKLNLSLQDIKGDIQVVSQFTLYGDARKGRRPSFVKSARPDHARPLYERLLERLRDNSDISLVESGAFGKHMMVSLVNDGPVTILLDSEKMF